jgi:hypothetical protein
MIMFKTNSLKYHTAFRYRRTRVIDVSMNFNMLSIHRSQHPVIVTLKKATSTYY